MAPSRFIVDWTLNTLRPRQNGRHFADDIYKCIFLNEHVWISIKISLKFVPKGPINNIPALVQIMAWRRPGDKPLSEAMMVNLPTRICVSRPQWVKSKLQYKTYDLENYENWKAHLRTLMPRQNDRYFADDIFRPIVLNEIVVFRIKLHWDLFQMVYSTINRHWYR